MTLCVFWFGLVWCGLVSFGSEWMVGWRNAFCFFVIALPIWQVEFGLGGWMAGWRWCLIASQKQRDLASTPSNHLSCHADYTYCDNLSMRVKLSRGGWLFGCLVGWLVGWLAGWFGSDQAGTCVSTQSVNPSQVESGLVGWSFGWLVGW